MKSASQLLIERESNATLKAAAWLNDFWEKNKLDDLNSWKKEVRIAPPEEIAKAVLKILEQQGYHTGPATYGDPISYRVMLEHPILSSPACMTP